MQPERLSQLINQVVDKSEKALIDLVYRYDKELGSALNDLDEEELNEYYDGDEFKLCKNALSLLQQRVSYQIHTLHDSLIAFYNHLDWLAEEARGK